MSKKQIILYCNYTSCETRSHLYLSNLKMDNVLRNIMKVPELRYIDAASWIEAFIKYFQNQQEYVLHIVAIQMGMKKSVEHFVENGVHYHYVKSGLGFMPKVLDVLFGTQKKKGYPIYQRRFKDTLKGIKPYLVMICGAENPDYAMAFLNNECPNKLVILQTLMNDPKRIAMGVSTDYRREIEDKVIHHSNHFAVPDSAWIGYIKSVNPNAICHPFTFPTIEPIVDKGTTKQYDFVFYAGMLGRNKGTNDVISALGIVVKQYPDVTLNIIGGADELYMSDLRQQIKDEGIEKNIVMTPSYPVREDVFKQVIKSHVAVLPGITASLNSTVREAMLMGMPTITYETPDTIQINREKQSILTAKMESIEDLANAMIYALNNQNALLEISHNGEKYAKASFSQEAFNDSIETILKEVS